LRRRIALIAAFLSSAAFAAVPSTVASGDSAGGTAAPSGAALQGQPPPPPLAASPGHPALEPPPGAVVRQTITLNGAVAPDDAGRPVAVQQRLDGSEWTDVGTVPSASDGSFSVRWRPTATGQVPLRAALADADGARAADADPEIDVTVYRRVRASWYGPGMYGGKTACGQRLTPTLLGVAHRRLPCGTQVRLFYGGRTVTVPVIDRGPYANGASFDLTKATADQLGADGVFSVGYAIIPV
jgi:rare lipoprotein A